MVRHCLPLVLLCPLLSAQQTIVSPAPASALVEGNGSNTFPFVSNLACRYMQVHSDIGGTPKVITRIAFRRNGTSAAQPGGMRSVDLELYMGESVEWDHVNYVFASNYLTPPTLVVPRQVVNLGPLAGVGSPAPFEMTIPLATPFVYLGLTALAWEVVQYSNVSGGLTSVHDSESGSSTTGAVSTLTGAGCIATGQGGVMDLDVQHVDRGGAYQFGLYVKLAPANAPLIVFIGSADPALSVPGLCGTVHTNLLFPLTTAVADASGFLGERGTTNTLDYPSALCTFIVNNTIGGATLYAQAHAVDFARPDPIPVCNSNGRSWTVPFPNTGTVTRASRLYNFQLQGPGYPHATPLTLSHGYAAVTEFTY